MQMFLRLTYGLDNLKQSIILHEKYNFAVTDLKIIIESFNNLY